MAITGTWLVQFQHPDDAGDDSVWEYPVSSEEEPTAKQVLQAARGIHLAHVSSLANSEAWHGMEVRSLSFQPDEIGITFRPEVMAPRSAESDPADEFDALLAALAKQDLPVFALYTSGRIWRAIVRLHVPSVWIGGTEHSDEEFVLSLSDDRDRYYWEVKDSYESFEMSGEWGGDPVQAAQNTRSLISILGARPSR